MNPLLGKQMLCRLSYSRRMDYGECSDGRSASGLRNPDRQNVGYAAVAVVVVVMPRSVKSISMWTRIVS